MDEFDRTLIDRSYPTTNAAAAALLLKMQTALNRLMEARGSDPTRGRSLYRLLRAIGLVDVGMEGKSPGAYMMRANFEQVREEAVNAGFITNEEIDQVLTLLDDPDFASSAPAMFTAWGLGPNCNLKSAHIKRHETPLKAVSFGPILTMHYMGL